MLFASRSSRRPALLLACAAVGVGCLTAGPAAPQAVAAPSSVTAVGADTPTDQEIEEARRAAEQSAQVADQASAELQAQQALLDALATQAGEALEAYQQASEARDAAVAEQVVQQQRLAEAEATLAEGKKDLGQWASQAYRQGGTLQEYSGLVTVLQQSATDEAASALASVKRIGDGRSNAVEAYQEAQRVQADATARAAQAALDAQTYADQATAAKQQADALVAQQRDQVAQVAALQAEAAGRAGADAGVAEELAQKKAEADALAAAARSSSGFVGSVGDCSGASLSGYANGLLPRSALCPLWGASNHVLRADAANAFQALSQAYYEEFGTPISVTDSYRTLAEQIDVKARKPTLAARPGTSRHGLGIALDLGGGIQSAGTTQHEWMDRNAALYGWINPAWAQNRSGQFEPWHWEFVG